MSSVARHCLLVAYDVRDPVRLRRIHAAMLGYGDPLQYSIFFCELSPTEQAIMESAILRVVRPSVDSVLIVNLGPASGVAAGRIRTLGTASLPSRQRFQIV